MSFDLVEAVRELPDMPIGELYARFFGWYRDGQPALWDCGGRS